MQIRNLGLNGNFAIYVSGLLSILAFSLSSPAQTPDDCSPKRLDQDGPFQKIPVYDQNKFSFEGSGICYAACTSGLIDAYRFEKDDSLERLSSPISLALNYKLKSSDADEGGLKPIAQFNDFKNVNDLIDGGLDIRDVFRFNQKKALCDQRWLEKIVSMDASKVSDNNKFLRKNITSIQNYLTHILFQLRYANGDKTLPKSSFSPADKCFDSYFKPIFSANSENLERFSQAIKAALEKQTTIEALAEFNEKICQDHQVEMPDMKIERYPEDTSDKSKKWGDLRSKVNTLLDDKSGSRPATIGFDDSILYNDQPVRDQENGLSSIGDGHCAVIIGRRPKGKNCEYLVRNSHGSCTDSSGQPKYDRECENGSVWVPAQSLFKLTREVYFYDR